MQWWPYTQTASVSPWAVQSTRPSSSSAWPQSQPTVPGYAVGSHGGGSDPKGGDGDAEGGGGDGGGDGTAGGGDGGQGQSKISLLIAHIYAPPLLPRRHSHRE